MASNKALLFLICVLLSPSRALLHLSTQTPLQLKSLNPSKGGRTERFHPPRFSQRQGGTALEEWQLAPLLVGQEMDVWTNDSQASPNNPWMLSVKTTPWTILWLTCTVRGYTKIQGQDVYLTTTCPHSCVWYDDVQKSGSRSRLCCMTLYISTVKQSPCPEESEV